MNTLLQQLQQPGAVPIVGVINAYAAKLAEQAGCPVLYLSGAGVANAQFAWPDLGLTSLPDVCTEVTRISQATSLPLLVDADTGWGSPLNIKNSIKLLEQAGASGVHIEDQLLHKRCGHREGKQLVSLKEMVVRISAACHGRRSSDFVIMARTDALAVESETKTLERIKAYIDAGAHAIFLEAVTSLEQITRFKQECSVPLLINLTEFGKTPNWSRQECEQAGANAVLYPLSAFRAMNFAAQKVFTAIMKGSQQPCVDIMQSRKELYQILQYEQVEQELDDYLKEAE